MACGVHLGILLVCLVQAERARCSWSQQAPASQRRGGGGYAGSGPLQGELRQAPVSAASAHGGGLSEWTHASADGRQTSWRRVKVQKLPPAHLDWFTPISSGSSINHFTSKKTSHDQSNQYLFSNGVSPSKTSDSQSPAQRPQGSAAGSPGPVGADASSEGQTLACGLGKRVTSRRRHGSSKAPRFPPPPNERPPQIPVRRNPPQSSTPASNAAVSCASYAPDWPRGQSAARSPSKRGRFGSASGAGSGRASRTFSIPQRLGGHAIRRPPAWSEQEGRILKPQQPASYKPRGQKVRWYKVKLRR
ncbi:uncharacterized protein LOC114866287 [Betta splendens]|uniref:Uncharacterized protein LOC114866287 n=1 Tax=Betta splendens TaxID=158456 RepID=A0A6P7NVH4_BETSP|nr:uncharacterized protein LOC114866287 [Betta splendens]